MKNISLRKILYAPGTSYAMQAHDGISAKIAEQAGFSVLWASGFAIATALGHRDCNEISWTNVVEQVGYIADATRAPILVDGDTGFGNFNNVRELVKKLCKAGASGVCLEDKIFPKTNSFLSYNQQLAPIEEFVGKIRAARDARENEEFCIVARTEALIAGFSMEEALKRAYSYKDAGADALLIHSKKMDPSEIITFCKHWDYSIPLIIVPTKYAPESAALYAELKISLVIWANQLIRASIFAMQEVAASLYRDQSPHKINEKIASMEDVFTLVDEAELKNAEKKYCPYVNSSS